AEAELAMEAAAQDAPDEPETDERAPVTAGVSGVNGATAIGTRGRFPDRS
ncbi:undecaprenyl/decaprenyl-phosphate alpha-N-acetylglucosaminyl 1-phosphate transferase, partial [Streptomyces sp. SID6137]|nr:undecaprenyl/decaprenyl-phosphate alpha-N-acetylglucosaminyl 1-phosphate transferase [Streptomyces sp. SID6137]